MPRIEPVPPKPITLVTGPWGAYVEDVPKGPYASTDPRKLLDLFEQEAYYSRVDGSAGMLIYTETRKELLRRLGA